jgi:DNA-binding MarR family transcriptional regulator
MPKAPARPNRSTLDADVAADRRGIRVRLTPKGLELINQMLPLHVANEQEALACLDNEERQELDRLLGKLVDGLSAG